MPEVFFKVESCDGKFFRVSERALLHSKVLGVIVENLGVNPDDAENSSIPVAKVNGTILEKVFEWCEHYKETDIWTEEDIKKNKTSDFCEWDKDFLFNMDNQMLYDIILAANYLEIVSLFEMACKRVADMIKIPTAMEVMEDRKLKEAEMNAKNDE